MTLLPLAGRSWRLPRSDECQPSPGPKVRRAETQQRHALAKELSHPACQRLNEEVYTHKIQPLLAGIANPVIMSALGVSITYAVAIRAGRRRPHPALEGAGGTGWIFERWKLITAVYREHAFEGTVNASRWSAFLPHVPPNGSSLRALRCQSNSVAGKTLKIRSLNIELVPREPIQPRLKFWTVFLQPFIEFLATRASNNQKLCIRVTCCRIASCRRTSSVWGSFFLIPKREFVLSNLSQLWIDNGGRPLFKPIAPIRKDCSNSDSKGSWFMDDWAFSVRSIDNPLLCLDKDRSYHC